MHHFVCKKKLLYTDKFQLISINAVICAHINTIVHNCTIQLYNSTYLAVGSISSGPESADSRDQKIKV